MCLIFTLPTPRNSRLIELKHSLLSQSMRCRLASAYLARVPLLSGTSPRGTVERCWVAGAPLWWRYLNAALKSTGNYDPCDIAAARGSYQALSRMVSNSWLVPGVVAMVTDRSGNIYEGAAGKRMLCQDADMTTDCVFAIFSTTKAITGIAVMKRVEEDKLDLDAPAKNYAPDIGKLQVLSQSGRLQASRSCARRSAISPPSCKRRTPPASATIPSTRTTTGSPANTASQASLLRRRHR